MRGWSYNVLYVYRRTTNDNDDDDDDEMRMIRWMCGVKLREFLGLELVSMMAKKSRLRWFGHVECKDDNDWTGSNVV